MNWNITTNNYAGFEKRIQGDMKMPFVLSQNDGVKQYCLSKGNFLYNYRKADMLTAIMVIRYLAPFEK